ncbi:CST complex subunit TEN1-like [Paramuricea clavata]|uniref:CST complex subunit TEN1-like n=1 Tax=Paramuricea clavata TaxID=317549 RepID=A0A6S7KDN6_PARCT|nr:CST complex subunit TEN1-like [Paramuricea clavata]
MASKEESEKTADVKVISHDIHTQQAIVMDDAGEKLSVNTANIEPYGFTLGLYYNLIGDMVKSEKSIMTLQVRTVTCIDELDIDLFVKALELRRKFLNEKVT